MSYGVHNPHHKRVMDMDRLYGLWRTIMTGLWIQIGYVNYGGQL
jgi:hypothetical protein